MHNSINGCRPILLKLRKYFLYNADFTFLLLFRHFELSFYVLMSLKCMDCGYLVCTIPLTVQSRYFLNFTSASVYVCVCVCVVCVCVCVCVCVFAFCQGLKMCVCFWFNPKIFLSFFPSFDFSQFCPLILLKCIDRVQNPSYRSIPIFLKIYTCFCRGLKMCICFWYHSLFLCVLLFINFELSHFCAQILSKCLDSRYLAVYENFLIRQCGRGGTYILLSLFL